MSEADESAGNKEPTILGDEEIPSKAKPKDVSVRQERLGDFELIREIGHGGMGVVHAARQISLNRSVAVKVLPPALGMSPQTVRRFEQEAHAAARLHHTNIVPIYSTGEQGGQHFYAMELVEGQSLDQVIDEIKETGSNELMQELVQSLPEEGTRSQGGATTSVPESASTSLTETSAADRKWLDATARLLSEVADALHYAHGRGVIHRDIKPANLMLSRDGRLMITDFGLARLIQEPGLTVSGSFMGTPAYMSPEQIAAGRMKLDHRTDVYSLGVVLYEVLTLQRPFPGESREEVVAAIMTKEPRPPRRFNRKIPVDLETICLKAMEKDPDRRYQNAGELAHDLRQYLMGGLIGARRSGILRRSWKAIRRHPVSAIGGVAAFLVLVSSGLAWVSFQAQSGEASRRGVADATLALKQGLYREGLEKIDQALQIDPDLVEARLVRARLLIQLYHHREAAEEAQWVLERHPDDWTSHAILAGLARYPATQFRLVGLSAESHLTVVEAVAPDAAEAFYLRALSMENARERIALLDRALDLDPADAEAIQARIWSLEELEDFDRARADADRLITARPRSSQGWRMKAEVYRLQRDYEQAQAAIERAIKINPEDPLNFVQRAAIRWHSGDHDGAVADLIPAIELDPTNAYFFRLRAEKLNGTGRFQDAVEAAEKSIELNPDDQKAFGALLRGNLALGEQREVRATLDELRIRADLWADRAARAEAYQLISEYYRQLKDYERAGEAIELAIESDPDGFAGFIFRRLLRAELGDSAGARADCQAAARLEIEEPHDLIERGWSMIFDCADPEHAVLDFTRTIDLLPLSANGYYGRGTAYASLERYAEALQDLDQAVEIAPRHAGIYRNRAVVQGEMDRFEAELADQKRSLELNPHDATTWSNYGINLFALGRVVESLAAQEKAIDLNPRFGAAHANRADALAWTGRCADALEELRLAEEVSPLVPTSRANIASAHLLPIYFKCPAQYDLEEAMRHLSFAYEARPERLRHLWALASYRRGEFAEAKRLSLELYLEQPDAEWFTLAMALWRLGETQDAMRFYEKSATWMNAKRRDHPVLRRQRDEAAQMLGIGP
jgi:serine/threonine protein kinase/Tfp pilus assembly protein PilF